VIASETKDTSDDGAVQHLTLWLKIFDAWKSLAAVWRCSANRCQRLARSMRATGRRRLANLHQHE
jgi:hypothetical protein